jgi:ABC-type antimicrobial peptide transport system permease subunit
VSETRLVSRVATLRGRPPSSLGLRFAVERPAGAIGTSTHAAMVTVAAGVAGLLAASMFSASLDRLVATPVRYGYPTDLVIADAGPQIAASFANDTRFDKVIAGASADLLIDGRAASGSTQQALVGALEWELASGRPPAAENEIVIGTRIAKELHKGVGDSVDLEDVSGDHHRLTVVGVGVVPNYGGGGLGRSAALTETTLRDVAAAEPFGEMGLSVKPGVDVNAVLRELADRYEVEPATPPREVANLQQVDRIPLILGLFLTVLCLATLGHAITMTARHRRRDLAVARALGFVPRQSATSVVVMALVTTLSGLIVAVPFGVLVGAFVWRRVAEGSALLGHVAYPWITLACVLPVGVAIAVVLAAIPARRAAHDRILYNLRPE